MIHRGLSADLGETPFKDTLIRTAQWYGWVVHHGRPARAAQGWRTAIQGDAGFPDIVLARGGRLIVAELKTATGMPTKEQRRWLAELGPNGRLWRPSDWADILRELASP